MWLSKSRFVCNCHHKLFTTVARILYIFFLSLFAGKCLQRITRNCFQTVTRNCLQTTTVKCLQRITRNCFQTVMITRSCLQTTTVKSLQNIIRNCFQTVTRSCWQRYFTGCTGKVSVGVAVAAWDWLQLWLRGIAVSDWLQKKTCSRKKSSVCGSAVDSSGNRYFWGSLQYARNQRQCGCNQCNTVHARTALAICSA